MQNLKKQINGFNYSLTIENIEGKKLYTFAFISVEPDNEGYYESEGYQTYKLNKEITSIFDVE